MTPETSETPERQPYPDESRAATLDVLRQIIGEPDPAMLQVVAERDEEFAARRAHAA